MICNDCPRKCGVDRSKTVGRCGGGEKATVAKTVDPFEYEEPCLGKLTAVFFGGCSLGCSYCQNIDISRGGGKVYDAGELAALFDGASGALDLVTPTHYIGAIERALFLCKKEHSIIYNTSGYETTDAVKRAREFTGVFLTDLKYADEETGARYSRAPDYFEYASAAIKEMRKTRDVRREVNSAPILERGLIVRHLVLPGHVDNSLRVLDWIAAELGTDTVISLMSQFTPNGVGEPSRKISKLEYRIVTEHALKLGFTNGYFQDMRSASAAYIPNFRG
ncbi:MAG: radical SAM protein [Roseburia sp.]|nr:radical SAM protein [Roseburia sp.]